MNQVWVVGKDLDSSEPGASWAWGLVGVFSTEEKAIDACLDGRYFLGPVQVDENDQARDVIWPGAYRPVKLKRAAD